MTDKELDKLLKDSLTSDDVPPGLNAALLEKSRKKQGRAKIFKFVKFGSSIAAVFICAVAVLAYFNSDSDDRMKKDINSLTSPGTTQEASDITSGTKSEGKGKINNPPEKESAVQDNEQAEKNMPDLSVPKAKSAEKASSAPAQKASAEKAGAEKPVTVQSEGQTEESAPAINARTAKGVAPAKAQSSADNNTPALASTEADYAPTEEYLPSAASISPQSYAESIVEVYDSASTEAQQESDSVFGSVRNTAESENEAAAKDDFHKESAPTFSYTQELAAYPPGTPGVKHEGFKNITPAEVTTGAEAIARAKGECDTEYDSARVFRDEETDTWKVDFYTEGNAGDCRSIYMNSDGITKLTVSGE